ncbi:MAG: AAA family ATPase, partial [Snowella sp.]|nr:AAA family ATPase [Snowella sp.]
DNGSGKSTFLRAISLILIFDESPALRESFDYWIRKNSEDGRIYLDLIHDENLDNFVSVLAKDQRLPPNPFKLEILLANIEGKIIAGDRLHDPHNQTHPCRFISAQKSRGLFSAAYGPFRRFTGGDEVYQSLVESHPRLAAHLSIFGENVAFTECLKWLKNLRFKQLEEKAEGQLLESILNFVNQSNFLPFNARIDSISSDGVTFVDGNGCIIPVEEMSDGYRSILSMTFELIQQLVRVYGQDQIFDPQDVTKIIVPGVVLIDEIDVHLHPTWQRRIGFWFREHFPNIQFIVTTHSPLICQAATVGSVYRLPKPGTNENGEMITGQKLDRLLYGNVLDAYGTEAFGANVARSKLSQEKLKRLAQLNQKAKYETLSHDECQERTELKAMMPTNPDTTNYQ